MVSSILQSKAILAQHIVWPPIVICLISFSIATLAVGLLAHSRASRLALDRPNTRSLHSLPVPRTGGIGLLLGVVAGFWYATPRLPITLWLAAAILFCVSLLDDLHGLSASVRLLFHVMAATLACAALLGTAEPILFFVCVVLAIVWMCNLYNFMDGSDGLAGGMTFFGFLSYAAAALLAGSLQFALLNLAVAAAAGGFLLHNFHPARIFLGDAGSVSLGFLAAIFGIMGWMQNDWTWWFPIMVFSPFIVDANITLLRRLLSGARIWEAHRDHYYQRLVLMGLGHRGTAIAEYALMAFSGAIALWSLALGTASQFALFALVISAYAALTVSIDRAWRNWQSKHA